MSSQVLLQDLYLDRARASLNVQDCMNIYDKWAATYNDEVGDKAQDYVAPTLVAQVAISSCDNPAQCAILDAGCGTGLVGQELAAAGARTIDGLDLSLPMLEIAKKTGTYRDLAQADLTQPINKASEMYDVITCVGTFTLGHVGPKPALREFIRVLRNKGVIVATILEEIWTAGGFKAEVERMQAENLAAVVSDGLVDYVRGHGDKAILLVLEKIAPM